MSQLLGEDRFQDIEKIKTIGSTYMAVSGLSPEKQVRSSRFHSVCMLTCRTVSTMRELMWIKNTNRKGCRFNWSLFMVL